jgi:hypothetical protein
MSLSVEPELKLLIVTMLRPSSYEPFLSTLPAGRVQPLFSLLLGCSGDASHESFNFTKLQQLSLTGPLHPSDLAFEPYKDTINT